MNELRQKQINQVFSKKNYNVLIIGGGINGIGTFRDLALQGVDVLMIDQSDFCSGASSASSHMIHGGLRYLENGEFRLIREAIRERNRLIRNAPHYVKSLPTTVPIFKWFSGIWNAPLKFLRLRDRPSERGGIIIKIGLTFYDLFSRSNAVLPNHRFRSKKASLDLFPKIDPKIIATATYFDAAMLSPERIAIELMTDAESENRNAIALNYIELERIENHFVILRDRLTDREFRIKPKIVVNATGPWIDLTNEKLDQKTDFIGGTKGSHLVIDHPELRQMIGKHEIFFENDDGRIVLIFPFFEKVLIGTTDIRVETPDARCTDAEIDYMIKMVRRVFPTISIDRAQIVFQFSGVRPLPKSDLKTVGQISRDHRNRIISASEKRRFPIYNLIGGKWTTFRAFSENVTDRVLDFINRERKIDTSDLEIGGGRNFPKTEIDQKNCISEIAEKTKIGHEIIEKLFDRYGTRSREIAEFLAKNRDTELLRSLKHNDNYFVGEVFFLSKREKVVHLIDLILRRTSIGMRGETTLPLLIEIAEILGDQWDAKSEVDLACKILREKHGVNF